MNYFLEHLLSEFQFPLTNPVLVFSLMLFIILLSPIVLRRIRIPGIIGLILSGIIIGPKGLGVIGENSLAAEGWIKLFSTIGLLYIMFMAGLELDLNQFRRYYKKVYFWVIYLYSHLTRISAVLLRIASFPTSQFTYLKYVCHTYLGRLSNHEQVRPV